MWDVISHGPQHRGYCTGKCEREAAANPWDGDGGGSSRWKQEDTQNQDYSPKQSRHSLTFSVVFLSLLCKNIKVKTITLKIINTLICHFLRSRFETCYNSSEHKLLSLLTPSHICGFAVCASRSVTSQWLSQWDLVTMETTGVQWTHRHIQDVSLRGLQLEEPCDSVHYPVAGSHQHTVFIKGWIWSTIILR